MRAVLLLTVLAAVAVTGAWWLSGLPGTVSANIAGTTLEASTPVALTLLGLLFLVLYAIVRFLAGLTHLPRASRRWRAGRNRARGDAAVNRALVALAANDAGAARREADRSRRLLGDTPLTLLLTAQAGRQAGRDADAQAAFELLANTTDGRLLGLRGLLRLAVARQDWPAAASIAEQAEAAHPGATWLQDERRHMALRTGQWREALRLSGPDSAVADTRAALAVAAADQETDAASALRLAKQAWAADPALPVTAIAYATRLRAAGKGRAAQDVLRRAWTQQPHPDLAVAYLEPTRDKLARVKVAAQLAATNASHPDSALLQARTAMEAGLTTEARRYIEAARDTGANQRRFWVMLADIAEVDGNAAEAQDALRHAATADPDPVWRCANCGTIHAAWHPLCDACGAAGKIAWVEPGHLPPVDKVRPLLVPQDADGLT